ncbi:hypothetical protein [Sulfurimonas sp.]|jgi:hypothetical protein|uniref:hypothetical protein n=1 Tax=Sulfurimonas sp. TaxID=2022749 RepID=UPI0025FC9431|nr:hypothetical protein [Sulfurimonas sp.]MCK9472101.1 hypothetical protein [Sulfurimonas sp.]
MSDDFEKLKRIGIQKIHETTHIARAHIQAIFNENFEEMSSVQLFGFISILEREYTLDLSELRANAKEFFKTNTLPFENTSKVKIFATPKKKSNATFIYTIIALVAAVLTLLYFASRAPQTEVAEIHKTIESAAIIAQDDENSSKIDENSTQLLEPTEVEEVRVQAEAKPITLKIIPKTRVWLGYIDLSDYKKYQKVFSDELELNTTKDWLLSFGHGHVDIEINGEVKSFKDPKNIRFSYIDSELKEINFEEFKSLNKGSGW